MNFFTGSAVWAHQGWVGNFFPKGTKQADYLREYAKRLTTVEGNTTFWATPLVETVLRWAQETPAYFRFCPKLPRGISHAGQLMPHLSEAQRFVDLMRNLGTRLGPMFLQLPPRYSPKLSNDLQKFLSAWPREVKLALEVRHLDWFSEPHHSALNDLLRAHDVARVLIDTRPIRNLPDAKIEGGRVQVLLEQAQERKPDVPLLPERTASFAFVRYIGNPDVPANAALLDEWADRMAGWLEEPCEGSEPLARLSDVYAFCHCPDETFSPQICRELHQRVAARVPIDPLPWDDADRAAPAHYTQASLF
ncbi:MAG: DUF72 domain-containing protein [Chloroflexi bacterium]|nr:DUF72 domain-containing protein [Chloroflexota bacterium]